MSKETPHSESLQQAESCVKTGMRCRKLELTSAHGGPTCKQKCQSVQGSLILSTKTRHASVMPGAKSPASCLPHLTEACKVPLTGCMSPLQPQTGQKEDRRRYPPCHRFARRSGTVELATRRNVSLRLSLQSIR